MACSDDAFLPCSPSLTSHRLAHHEVPRRYLALLGARPLRQLREKTYGALVQEVGKAKTEQFFPRARGKKADAGEAPPGGGTPA